MKNYYEILELDSNASFKEIRSAYRSLSKKYHPDVNPGNLQANERFNDLQEAYSVLKDGIKREEFDENLRRLGIRTSPLKQAQFFFARKFKKKNQEEFWMDDENDQMSFRPQFKSSSRSYYRGAFLAIGCLLAVMLIVFMESNLSDDSFQAKELVLDSELTSDESTASEESREMVIPQVKNNARNSIHQTGKVVMVRPADKERAKKPIQTAGKKTFSATPKRESPAPTPPDPKGEQAPMTIFTVNRISPPRTDNTETTPSVASRTVTKDVNKVYRNVEKKPSFAGGSAAFVKYLNENLQYPQVARESGINGRVLVNFIVERDGKLSNISVIKGIGGGCDEEAIRVMKNAPSWIPGEEDGERVRVQATIPITFKLQ